MPIYLYRCPSCGTEDELLEEYENLPSSLACTCGEYLLRVVVNSFGRHGSWSGIFSGYFDRGLGMYIEDYHHREKVMAEKGLRPAPDLKADDERIDELVSKKLEHEKQTAHFQSTLETSGSMAKALEAITPEI